MNVNNLKRAFVVLLFSTLTACIEIHQNMMFEDLDNVNYQMEMRFDSTALALAQQTDQSLNICDDISPAITKELTVKVDKRDEFSDTVCIVSLSGTLDAVSQFKFGGDVQKLDQQLFQITYIDDYSFRIESKFDLRGPEYQLLDNPFMGAMLSIFKGRTFKWELHAPNIKETNGELRADNQHVTWEVPLSDAINDVHTFYAVIQHDQPWYQPVFDFFGITLE